MLSINNNRKLKAGNIATFNLPARRDICGRECPDCYAKKSQRLYRAVLPFREKNYQQSLSHNFVNDTIDEIKHLKKAPAAIRIHESGEFYSQDYVDKWTLIVMRSPNTLFYAYTKNRSRFDMSSLESLPNMVLIDSCKFGIANYGDPVKVKSWAKKGAFVCPSSKTVSCGNGCSYCLTKTAQATGVVFHKH